MMIDTQAEGRSGVVPQVVLHGFSPEGAATNEYKISNIDGATNITQYVRSVSWSHSVRAPYETIQLELVFPGSVFQSIMPGVRMHGSTARAPATGFWVVLYLPNEDADQNPIWTAVHWGYATQLRIRSVANPTGAQTVSVSVSCESWVGLLRRNAVFLAPGSNFVREGSSYDLRGWSDAMTALISSSVNKPPGDALAKLFHLMAVQLMPNTLTSVMGDYLEWSAERVSKIPFGDGQAEASSSSKCYLFRDVIKVVWNRELCAKHAPMRVLNHKEIAGQGLGTVGSAIPRGSTWNFLEATFFASPNLECFPSLEWPFLTGVKPMKSTVASDSESAAGAYVSQGQETDTNYYSLPISEALTNDDIAVDYTIEVPAPFNGDLDDVEFPLGKAFGGANPVLIYRMRPTLLRAINSFEGQFYADQQNAWVVDEVNKGLMVWVAPSSSSENLGVNQATQVVSAAPNIDAYHWYTYLANEVYDVTWAYSEDTRTNMVFARTPYRVQSQLETHGMLGQPLVDNADVAKHGLRLRTIEWPFFPPDGVEQSTASLSDQLTALNEEMWMDISSHDQGTFFGQGSVRGVYKPWLKAGHYMNVHWGEYGDQGEQSTWAPYVKTPSDDPNASPAEQGNPGFTGYIQSVTHSVQVGARGEIVAFSSLQLERVAVQGANTVPYNYPPHSPQLESYMPTVIDPATGEEVRGKLDVDEDGNLTFEEL